MARLFRKRRRSGGYYPHWYAKVYDPRTGRWPHISTHCTAKEAAQRVADERESDLALGRRRASGAATFGQAVEAKLAEDLARIERGELSRASWTFYRAKGAMLVASIGSGTPLVDIDAAAVERFVHARLVDDGAARHTVTKELVTLRQVLRQAKRRGEWHGDLEVVMPERWKVGYEPRRRWLTEDDADRFLAQLAPAARAWVCLALVTGGSASEVERIEHPRDVGAWTIHVRGTKRATRDRVVPILPHVWRFWLEAWTWLELNGRIHPWAHDTNRCRALKKAAARAGVLRVSANDLRRTAAMWVRQASRGELAGLFLGHADSRMVDRVYARLAGAELGGAIVAAGERATPVAHAQAASTLLKEPSEQPTKRSAPKRKRGK